MKIEIEVKAKIKDFDAMISSFEKIGCVLSEPVVQDDCIYNKKEVDLYNNNHDTPVLRIREQEGRILFTLKKNRTNELDCIEKEVEVNDRNALKEIIELLDFEQAAEVHKKRIKTKYKDYEICLDEVDGLGSFIEVEKMSEEDGKKIQNELFDFLKTLGVGDEDRVLIGYDTMLWEKNNQK